MVSFGDSSGHGPKERVMPAPVQRLITRRRFLAASGAASAGLLLAACSGDESTTQTSLPTTAPAGGVPATKPDQLVVRSFTGIFEEALIEGAVNPFTEETGIPVQFIRTLESEAFTQIQVAIRAGQRPPIDVDWSLTSFGELARVQGLLTPLNPDIVTNMANLTPLGFASDGSTSWVGPYAYSFPIIYRADLVPDGTTFDSWMELFDEKFENAISFCDLPVCTLEVFAKLAGVTPGVDDMSPVWDLYRDLRPNIKLIGGLSVEPLISGEAEILIDINSFGLEGQEAEPQITWAVPEEGVVVDRDVFYAVSNTPEDVAYYSQVFINYVLAPPAQSAFAEILGAIPTLKGVEVPEFMQNDPAFPVSEELFNKVALVPDAELYARHGEEWQTEITNALKG